MVKLKRYFQFGIVPVIQLLFNRLWQNKVRLGLGLWPFCGQRDSHVKELFESRPFRKSSREFVLIQRPSLPLTQLLAVSNLTYT